MLLHAAHGQQPQRLGFHCYNQLLVSGLSSAVSSGGYLKALAFPGKYASSTVNENCSSFFNLAWDDLLSME